MPDAAIPDTRRASRWLRSERDLVELLRTTVLRRYLLGTQNAISDVGVSGQTRYRRISNEAHGSRQDQPQAASVRFRDQVSRHPSDQGDRQRPDPSPGFSQPSERIFRAATQTSTAPAVPAPQPAPPAPPAAQIDMGQLDRELWRRFEKRLRVETERRGRQ